MPWVEQLPSGKYRARYYLPSGAKRTVKQANGKTLAFEYKRAAKNAAAAAEEKASAPGWRDPRAALKTWGEWCEAWWPTRGVEPGTLKRDASSRDSALMPKWGDTPLIDITRFEVKAWAGELRASGMAPATVQRRVYLLSASLNAAMDAEILTSNPAYRIKLPGGETDVRRYLTTDEASDLMAQFKPPMRPSISDDFVPTLFGTGMRWGEAAGLQIPRVNFAHGSIRVAEVWDDEMGNLKRYPKGKKIRDVPIPLWLVPHLEHAIGNRKSGFVFLDRGHVIDYSNWRTRVWVPAVDRAKLAGTRPNDTRHTYASWLLQSGKVSLAEVGKLLGHRSVQTTQIYADLAAIPNTHVTEALGDPFGKFHPTFAPASL